MKLYKFFKNTMIILLILQICFKFCLNEEITKIKDTGISFQQDYSLYSSENILTQNQDNKFSNNKKNHFENFNTVNPIMFSEGIKKYKASFLERNSFYKNGRFLNNKKANMNSSKSNKTKSFFNYKLNKTNFDPDLKTYRDPDKKWNVAAFIKSADLILDAFIEVNPRLNVKYGKMWLAKILIKQFEECDLDKNDKLNLTEFKFCIYKQNYFNILSNVARKHSARLFTRQKSLQNFYPQVTKMYSKKISKEKEKAKEKKNTSKNKKNNSKDKKKTLKDKNNKSKGKKKSKEKEIEGKNDKYLEIIFELLNESNNRFFSLYEYTKLRFLMLVYRKCNVKSYFMSKNEFECIANEYDFEGFTKKSNSLSRIFNLIQSFSRYESYNDLDTINALVTWNSIQLFGKISNNHVSYKLDKNNLFKALDNNDLPLRYNGKNIGYIFSEMGNNNGENVDSIDLHTFVFVDRFLVIFHENSSVLKQINVSDNFIDINGFLNCFKNYLFPEKYTRLLRINLREYDLRNITKFELNKELNYIPSNLKESVENENLILLEKLNSESNINSQANKKISNSEQNLNDKQVTTTTVTRRVVRRSRSTSSNSNSGSKPGSTTTIITSKKKNGGVNKTPGNRKGGNNKGNGKGRKNPGKNGGKNKGNGNGGNYPGKDDWLYRDIPPVDDTRVSREKQKAETGNGIYKNNTLIPLPKNYDNYIEKYFDMVNRRVEDRELVRFDDFLFLIQFMYLYPKLGLKFNLFVDKDRLYEYFSEYSDYPLISTKFYSRFPQFKDLRENTIMDFHTAFVFFRYEDLLSEIKYVKERKTKVLSKSEIMRLLYKVHIRGVPDYFFNKCFYEKENRITKLESNYDVACMLNLCFEYIGQNINNNLASYHYNYNTINTEIK